jgi:hypothetical protein
MYYVIDKARAGKFISPMDSRAMARKAAKDLGGIVQTEAQVRALGDLYFKAAKPSIMDLAKGVAKASKKRATVGKKAKVSKRTETTPAVIASGEKALAAAIKAELNKVGIVRAVAKVASLQRRDVFAIIGKHPELDIAAATISTQFQVVRSGKAK